ncbi:hypothetical protein Taro_054142 [Colocasia esculenta]|uniref:Uncharacterized protein n=1 Tax=Colocasia esculenta TaxID=4460 RepID=A0A843XP55_COLES|nr:hypothetical protein [Colocasia esculenta]
MLLGIIAISYSLPLLIRFKPSNSSTSSNRIVGSKTLKRKVLLIFYPNMYHVSGEDSDEEEEHTIDECEDDDEDGAGLDISSSSEEEMDII